MGISQVSDRFFVTGQIQEADIAAIAANGFGGIICNRPDNEQFGQPSSEAIAKAAAKAGLAFHYIPVVPGQAGQAEVRAMAKALQAMDGRVLAYCRSGARSASLYHAAQSVAAQ